LLSFCLFLLGCTPKSSIEKIGNLFSVNLYGTWHEMGQQYGLLARQNIDEVHSYLLEYLGGNPESMENASRIAGNLYAGYPYRLKQFFQGVSETSGISLEDLILTNAVEYIVDIPLCSALAAYGDYASDGLVFGRSYDASYIEPLCKNLMVTVFHPSDGSLASAIIAFAGEIYLVNGINEKGIFMELDNGMPTVGFGIDSVRIQGTVAMLSALFDTESLDYLDRFFETTAGAAGFIIGATDGHEVRSYEWSPDGVKHAEQFCPEGVMAMANHYVNPDWSYPVPPDSLCWNSHIRRSNLLALAQKNKGSIDAYVMREIMTTPLVDGGPFHSSSLYQLVVEPSKGVVHVHFGPEHREDWTVVHLNW